MPRPPKARALILASAARIVRERGAAALTFDELVAASGITRGGITYHFRTKDELLRALVDHDLLRWEQLIAAHTLRSGCPEAGPAIGYIRAATEGDPEHRRFVAGMLGAVAHDPGLLDGCRALYRRRVVRPRWSDADLDGLIPLLAADGLFWMEQFGFLELPATTRRRLVARLEALARAAGGGRSPRNRHASHAQRTHPMSTSHRSRRPSRPAAAAAVAATLLAACSGEGGGPPQMPPPEVNVATVVAREVSAWDDYAGRIEAVEAVEIRPRVTGYLAAQHYTEGALVAQGALLFTIDDREYRAAVDAAAASLARARTRAGLAASELARAERLAALAAASAEEVERRRGELQQAEADVKSAEAQLVQARLNLEFTRVTAPIAGRTSLAEARPGNLVTAGSTRLTTVVSVDPVYVSFTGDERMYLRYQAQVRDGARPAAATGANPVRVGLADEDGWPHEGRVVFVDNAIDPATGTIRARAELANPEGRFTPGLFARVRVLSGPPAPALLVHERAILTDQDRKFVYVLGPNDTAQRRDVVLGAQVDGLRVITEGVAAGDRVVVNGSRKIFFPGMPVKPRVVPMDQPELAPPAAAAPAQGTGG